jgi:hypothetical protein
MKQKLKIKLPTQCFNHFWTNFQSLDLELESKSESESESDLIQRSRGGKLSKREHWRCVNMGSFIEKRKALPLLDDLG